MWHRRGTKIQWYFRLLFYRSKCGEALLVAIPWGQTLYYWHEGEEFVFSSEGKPLQELVQDAFAG